uniref:Integrase catalytic domain-containing protein n=1 Tax=Crocodylus porosus TaxID=8502 RepID=A0A7M4F0X7_CROPO
MKWVSQFGIPKEIVTDQGTNFMSAVMAAMCRVLHVTHLRTTVYHPQTNGLMERFNATLKGMLRRCTQEDPARWDLLVPPLLFAVRDAPQASMGYSPFRLVFGHQPQSLLDIVRESWETSVRGGQQVAEYAQEIQDRLHKAQQAAQDNLTQVQRQQKNRYDQGTRERELQPGQKVLVMLPSSHSKFEARWQGPARVIRRVGPVNYEVQREGRQRMSQILHINLLKEWQEPQGLLLEMDRESVDGKYQGLEAGSKTLKEGLPGEGASLLLHQKKELQRLIAEFGDVFTETPGKARGVEHAILMPRGQVAREKWQRIPFFRRQPIREELNRMLAQGIITPSRSPWRSPLVAVTKTDGSLRLCIDFRKVNALTQFDAFPMPQVNELVERIGQANFISTLDLAKGYWQIPLRKEDQPKTAFGTPWGLYKFKRMPFG